MIILYTIIAVLVTGFIFLPYSAKFLDVSIAHTDKAGEFLRFLYNVRYKLIAIITLYRPVKVGKVQRIFVHPLKSCSYIEVKEWEIDEYGFKYDRQYMIAYWDDKQKIYQPFTMRNFPRFSLIKLTHNLEENWFKFEYPILDHAGNNPNNEFKSFPLPCDVSPQFIKDNLIDNNPKKTNLWDVHFDSYDIGKALPHEFIKSMNINRPGTTLLYTSKGKLVKTYHPSDLENMRVCHFQDYFPMMMMTQEEIDECNEELKKDGFDRHVGPLNFRPNMVLSGLPKGVRSDNWHRIKIGDISKGSHDWSIAQKCPRCSIPNVKLESGTFDKQNAVSKTLGRYRKVDSGSVNNFFLGIYAIHHDCGYKMKVGDPVYVTEERVKPYRNLE